MYHNHNLEFETFAAENLPNAAPNRRILEYLLEGFAPDEMGITLDTYWVAAAGADVCDWISQMSNRIPCVHLKDMKVKLAAGHGSGYGRQLELLRYFPCAGSFQLQIYAR